MNKFIDMMFEAFRAHSSPTVDMGDAHGARGQSGMIIWESSHPFIRSRMVSIFDAYLLSRPLDDRSEADRASNMLMGVADYFAATLARADHRAWEHLLTYAPATDIRVMIDSAIRAAEEMRESAAKIAADVGANHESLWDPWETAFLNARATVAAAIRALPLPEPTSEPDPRDATIARLSAELATMTHDRDACKALLGPSERAAQIATDRNVMLSAELEAAREDRIQGYLQPHR